MNKKEKEQDKKFLKIMKNIATKMEIIEKKKSNNKLDELEQLVTKVKLTMDDITQRYFETSNKMRELCIDITNVNLWLNKYGGER
jgi:HPt (histidine-containing phosphotransfer) domain-containing protein